MCCAFQALDTATSQDLVQAEEHSRAGREPAVRACFRRVGISLDIYFSDRHYVQVQKCSHHDPYLKSIKNPARRADSRFRYNYYEHVSEHLSDILEALGPESSTKVSFRSLCLNAGGVSLHRCWPL